MTHDRDQSAAIEPGASQPGASQPGELGLRVVRARVNHGRVSAVADASLEVRFGAVTALVGPNAAGKTSLLTYLSGRTKGAAEAVVFDGESIEAMRPRERIRRGLVLVPQGRLLFPRLTVEENLQVVADTMRLDRAAVDAAADRFPVLAERWRSRVGNLSGGEQQMLAIARGLMCSPRMLLLDEPTLGLAPRVVADVMAVVSGLAADGVGVLIAEPVMDNVPPGLSAGWVMIRGRTVAEAPTRDGLGTAYAAAVGLSAADTAKGAR